MTTSPLSQKKVCEITPPIETSQNFKTQVKKSPLVIEKERINFDPDDSDADFIAQDQQD